MQTVKAKQFLFLCVVAFWLEFLYVCYVSKLDFTVTEEAKLWEKQVLKKPKALNINSPYSKNYLTKTDRLSPLFIKNDWKFNNFKNPGQTSA